MFGLFPEDENSARQTGWVTYDFHSPGSCDIHISKWVCAKSQLCTDWLIDWVCNYSSLIQWFHPGSHASLQVIFSVVRQAAKDLANWRLALKVVAMPVI